MLVKSIGFFYDPNKIEEKESFLQAYRLLFLSDQDEIIKVINKDIIEAKIDGNISKNEVKDRISNAFLEIRKKLNKNTNLTEKDFKHIS